MKGNIRHRSLDCDNQHSMRRHLTAFGCALLPWQSQLHDSLQPASSSSLSAKCFTLDCLKNTFPCRIRNVSGSASMSKGETASPSDATRKVPSVVTAERDAKQDSTSVTGPTSLVPMISSKKIENLNNSHSAAEITFSSVNKSASENQSVETNRGEEHQNVKRSKPVDNTNILNEQLSNPSVIPEEQPTVLESNLREYRCPFCYKGHEKGQELSKLKDCGCVGHKECLENIQKLQYIPGSNMRCPCGKQIVVGHFNASKTNEPYAIPVPPDQLDRDIQDTFLRLKEKGFCLLNPDVNKNIEAMSCAEQEYDDCRWCLTARLLLPGETFPNWVGSKKCKHRGHRFCVANASAYNFLRCGDEVKQMLTDEKKAELTEMRKEWSKSYVRDPNATVNFYEALQRLGIESKLEFKLMCNQCNVELNKDDYIAKSGPRKMTKLLKQ